MPITSPHVVPHSLASADIYKSRDNYYISVIENYNHFRIGSTAGYEIMLASGLDEPKRRFQQSSSGPNLSPSGGGFPSFLSKKTEVPLPSSA